MKHLSFTSPTTNTAKGRFGKMCVALLLIPLLTGALQSCCLSDDIHPDYLYGEWEMTSYTNSSDDIEVQKMYITFWKDNVITLGENSEVVDEVHFFNVIDNKLYIYDDAQEQIINYLTIIKLTSKTLILRADLEYNNWSECTFRKHSEISGNYYNNNGGVVGKITDSAK
ncbi:MAG: lipocalin family protein [Paludibacteraceae bacterium]